LCGWLRIRIFGGFSVPCEGGVFWWWGVWFSVEGQGCGDLEAFPSPPPRDESKFERLFKQRMEKEFRAVSDNSKSQNMKRAQL